MKEYPDTRVGTASTAASVGVGTAEAPNDEISPTAANKVGRDSIVAEVVVYPAGRRCSL